MSQDREKEGQDKSGGFKVVDRRRFNESGDERSGGLQSGDAQGVQPSVGSGGAAASAAAQISFDLFIFSLAHQARMQMGEIPTPPGVELANDPEAARQTIDIISMLEIKTRGNLEPEEQRLITEVLHDLRMSFVKRLQR